MDWLNYHHLLYFHTVVREGGVAAAAKKLHLTPQTISAQVRELEERLGEELLDRSSRTVRPTTAGRLVHGYAERIFGAGEEMLDALKGRGARPVDVVCGVSDAMPKAVVARLLAPLTRLPTPARIVADEGPADRLLAGLAVMQYDFVLSDAPAPPQLRVRAFSHLVGECGVTVLAKPKEAARLRRRFPASLDGAAFVLPSQGTSLRSLLDRWFDEAGIRPRVAAEVQDSALAKSLAEEGLGAIAAPAAVARDVARRHGLAVAGEAPGLAERFYVITTDRRIRHPAVEALLAGARRGLFGPSPAA